MADASSSLRAARFHRLPTDFDSPTQTPLRRRTPEGHYVSISSENIDIAGDTSNKDYVTYVVETDDPNNSTIFEEHYISNSIVKGGSDRATIAHHMDKVIKAKERISSCQIRGCDGEVMRNEQDDVVLPCECGLRICRECFNAIKEGSICPGCKEPYRSELDETILEYSLETPLRQSSNMPGSEIRSKQSVSVVNRTGDSGANRGMLETKDTSGFGSALRPNGRERRNENSDRAGTASEKVDKAWKPLSRKLKVSASIISPYRLLIFIRFVALGFFLTWRIRNPNHDAMWLWGMSIVCEIWFAFSWLLDQLPKLKPVSRTTDLAALKEKFEQKGPNNPTGKCDLPGIDVFVSTADPEKEPPLVTANTILSILAADYPVDRLACYVSDDGGALLTFESLAEAARFAIIWVPFCRKHNIEPRNPESYFSLKGDPYRKKTKPDFVKDRRMVKREYDEYKVRINSLPGLIRRRSETFNAREEEAGGGEDVERVAERATWMADETRWPGIWLQPCPDHSRGDHAAIVRVLVKPPPEELTGTLADERSLDFSEVDVRIPLLIYLSREKRPGYDHNKKAGAMNALVRASAVISNGPFILNLDCDHYVYNTQAFREGICFMMDKGGEKISFVQFPQRFEGIDPSDRYANHNTVFFDVNMRALDGLQGPVYVGTGCMFRRTALYGFDPPRAKDRPGWCTWCFPCFTRRISLAEVSEEELALNMANGSDEQHIIEGINPKRFGSSTAFIDSIPVAEYQGRPLADHPSIQNGRQPGALLVSCGVLDASKIAEAVSVISCWFEERTEWGKRVGWIYGSITEDVVTGYRMHNRGWRSVYCVTKRDAFRGTAPINLTDRLIQVLRWATGSVEIFFSRNNPLLSSSKLKFLQKLAYLNVCMYPFTSIFLIVYCFLPAFCLFSGQFITQTLSIVFLAYLLAITITLCLLALLEIMWSKISLEEWWKNEQFWLIGGTSAHLAAVFQGILKVIAGVEISFTLTAKSSTDDKDDEFAELYVVKWTSLMIPPITIMMTNLIAICVGFSRTIYSVLPQWSRLIGGVFFSFWVLAHLYPFAKGLMGRRGRIPTIVFIWSGLTAITVSLLWISISPPSQSRDLPNDGFQFP